jgi:3-deoxy-manno-octulosonate cytidylyltransferase (CMP-KDO synthetase)
MKAVGIIPARFASTRFPGKPLTLIHGKSMIERVYRRAMEARSLVSVVVATDDSRIYDHVAAFGGSVVMTDPGHQSGTDRCAEVVAGLGGDFDVVVNVQGDEPYIHPGQIDLVTGCFANSGTQISTLVKQITDESDLDNVNIPKVVMAAGGKALYFSRSLVPYSKPHERVEMMRNGVYFKHIGIYGYRASVLPVLAGLSRGKLEISESLEQLRWLENGYSIYAAISDHDNFAVDVPEDVAMIEARFPAD